MKSAKLKLTCPVCGSGDVFYSCTPNCCFNHVCNDCTSTFEPVTQASGGKQPEVESPDPLPESSDPTVACARCHSTKVYVLEDGRLVCGDCRSLLKLEITEIAPSKA